MPAKKTDLPPLSAKEKEDLEELIKDFTAQVGLVRTSRWEAGKIASELAPLYKRAGRKGGWTRFLRERGLKVRTVDDWILEYQRSINLRKPPEPKGPKGNVADSATFEEEQVIPSDNPDNNGREALHATFVLGKDEKTLFMAAVGRLGHKQATRLMYEALVGKP